MEREYEPPNERCQQIAECGGLPYLVVRVLTGLALVLGVAFAFAQSGPFDWSLLIQAAMLIVLIWYTYFTFRMVRSPAWVQLRLLPRNGGPALRPRVENKTERLLHARMTLRLWAVNGDEVEPLPQGPFYRGERFFPIPGRLNPAGVIRLENLLEVSDEGCEEDALLVDFKTDWIDDALCESGKARKFWRVDLDTGRPDAVIDPKRWEELFGDLKDPYKDAENVQAET